MGKETILILDENKNTTWTLKTLLENEGYCVLIVDSIERAITDFREFKVSGLITEYRFQGVSTLEAIRELKKMSLESYVMMITDDETEEDGYEEIMEVGIDDYFVKPVPIRKILLHLRKGLKYRNLLIEKKRLEKTEEPLRSSKGAATTKIKDALAT